MAEFTPVEARGLTCEIHLVVHARWHMFTQDYGYCGRRARWWYRGMLLCGGHKRSLETVLKEAGQNI